MEPQVQTAPIPVQPKIPFPWLILIISNLASVVVGLVIAKFFLAPSIPPQIVAPPTPTPIWQTFSNSKYKFSFDYPGILSLSELDNSLANQFVVTLTKPESTAPLVTLDIKKLSTSQDALYYLDRPAKSSSIVGGKKWDKIDLPQGYCDAGNCSAPFSVYQAINPDSNTRYAFIYYSPDTETTLLRILSTFKFINTSTFCQIDLKYPYPATCTCPSGYGLHLQTFVPPPGSNQPIQKNDFCAPIPSTNMQKCGGKSNTSCPSDFYTCTYFPNHQPESEGYCEKGFAL